MAKQKLTPEPASPGRFDIAVVLITASGLLSWSAAPDALAAGALLMLAGALNFFAALQMEELAHDA
jgi:hypothetical protein